uniref:microtubule-associated tumor suppressor candidate 2 homolog n=1 Tax=Solea senegalensis TaxID=28829 RepID=UPI001CD892B1|nr:microtubule-associated tumor suppressor candidate 2 homolog [Solea senegalensis]
MCERGEPFGGGELRNNNQQDAVLSDGDANANEIRTEDCGRMGDTVTLSGQTTKTAEQDKVIIWGTDSQCDDPELAEFEMLECQELEAYLAEDGEDFVGLADHKELKSGEERTSLLHCAGEQVSSGVQVFEGKEASRTELSSETDAYVSCLSTISSMTTAVDPVVRSQTTDSWHIVSGPYSTASEDLTLASPTCKADNPCLSSTQSTMHKTDINLNSTLDLDDVVLPEQVGSGAVPCKDVFDEHRKHNNNQRHKADSSISEGERDQSTSPHKTLPSTKASQEESNTKMDKSTQADEAPDVNISPSKMSTKETQSSIQSKAIRKQGSFDNTLKKQNSFDRSSKKQPSFENTFKKQLSFDNSIKKQGSFENTVASSSASLERRKPWGSPSRSATPPPSKATSCSPKRRPSGSPAKVQGIRALSLERSDSPQRGFSQTVKPPGKMMLSSGIPKPVMAQHKEPEPSRSSSPQKAKNIRPKIITYVRANQAKPQVTDSPHEAAASQLRLSSYSSPPAHKDPKVPPQPKSTPVLCSSNLLFDKYRQEMQKTGYFPPGMTTSGVKPPSTRGLTGKSGNFHEEGPEKYSQEHVSQDGTNVYRSPRTLRPQLGLGAVSRQPPAKTRVQQAGQKSTLAPSSSAQAAAVSTQDSAGEQKRSGPETMPKSFPLKPGQSGLRPPGFSALPVARLAAFGFVHSSSISSVSSHQSNDSGHSDSSRPSQHQSSGSDEAPAHRAAAAEASHGHSRTQPPNAPSLQRRTLPPQRCSPVASRREILKDAEAATTPKSSSPKRFAVVSPKPHSPGSRVVVIATAPQ